MEYPAAYNGERMKQLDILAIPYRDYWFQKRYGAPVRDLALLSALATNRGVARVRALCRPRVIYEPAEFVNSAANWVVESGISWRLSRSIDPIGPLGGRSWTTKCYAQQIREVTHSAEPFLVDCDPIILDFHPLADLTSLVPPGVKYAIDLIDNFTKHNRYSPSQRASVRRKYQWAEEHADHISGVSKAAVSAVSRDGRGLVLPNGLTMPNHVACGPDIPGHMFGFLGFITDKFDLEFVDQLCSDGHSILVAGQVLDSGIARELAKRPHVTLAGPYAAAGVSRLCNSFKIGVIPYRLDRSHDGSPLKLYEYLSHGRPAISNIPYEVDAPWVLTTTSGDSACARDFISAVRRKFHEVGYLDEVRACLPAGSAWTDRAARLIESISAC